MSVHRTKAAALRAARKLANRTGRPARVTRRRNPTMAMGPALTTLERALRQEESKVYWAAYKGYRTRYTPAEVRRLERLDRILKKIRRRR